MKMDSHTINTNGLKMDKDKHKIRNNKATKNKTKIVKALQHWTSNDLMDEISKPQATKPKPHKWDYSKLK